MSRTSERRARRAAQRRSQAPAILRGERRPWLYAAGAMALIVMAIVLFVLYNVWAGGPAAPGSAVGTAVPSMGQQHVKPGERHLPYNSAPPTSGPHYDTPGDWKLYDQPLAEETWIHNLEHGGIVALYNCPEGCPDLVRRLEELLKSGPRSRFGHVKLLITPYSKIPNRLTMVAWNYYLPLEDYNDVLVRGFIREHQDKGPELVP